jgi:wobble nucleotide-excising tRNase
VIFDGTFVAENVHSGEVVDIEHKRSLYRIIIGDAGVMLATKDAEFAAASRTKTTEITGAARAIQTHVPTGMGLDVFLTLPVHENFDAHISEQELALEAARQADAIKARQPLSEYIVPSLPDGIGDLLSRTIDDIAEDAESRLATHLAAHGMADVGGPWIATGTEYAGNSCPFCGQDIQGLPLIAAYRAIFSERFKSLSSDITAMKGRISQTMGEAALARLDTASGQNKADAEFWSKYFAIEPASFVLPETAKAAVQELSVASLSLIERKQAAPLTAIELDENFTAAQATYEASIVGVQSINNAIRTANVTIGEKKAAAGIADVRTAENELQRRRAMKTRHSEKVDAVCVSHAIATREKAEVDRQKETIRAQLDAHTNQVVRPYERRINAYLEAFNADFRITETKHAYPGGIATSSYQLVINDVAVDLGDGKTPPGRPSFKNTLSAGDKTTLALAFFLAHLEREPALANKVVVFDDPFNSQDAFRRRQTVHEIMKVARNCAQVVVLSHDATFLKQVWEKAPASERVAISITDHRAQGSKIMPIDLERACQGRTATDIDDLQTYLTTGAGAVLDIVRKMRVVLETYCRTTYPSSFDANDYLGDMAGKIRGGGSAHPAAAIYDEIDQINDYTKQYHHGENVADATPDQIDTTELTGYARRTLRIANALQA